MRVSVVFDSLPDDAGVRDALNRAQIILHGGRRHPHHGHMGKQCSRRRGSIDAAASPIGAPTMK